MRMGNVLFHVKQRIELRLRSKPLQKHEELITQDIGVLQPASSPHEFARAAVLMLADWRTRFANEPAALSFVEYFEKTWIHSPLNGWYEGFSP
uniref:Uncharacterized protein n=1 Tax=Ditylenchus dipsaci TaxID=166011 RepID=A0A915D9S8_9BILA